MKVHLMGIGGAGVSALARVFLARGDEVSGCDVRESDTTAELEDAGVRIYIGHDPEHVLFQDLLVYSGAIKSSPELDAARAMGVKVLSRAEMLAELINESDSIAVGGSAGKTTVTHMTGHILTEAGFDPTVLVGDGSSARAGRSRWLVAEVDESDGTLILHHPKRAIVTNIEFDHPDFFSDVDAVRDLFAQFVAALPADGDGVGVGYELGQHLGAREHFNAHRPCRLELGRCLDGAAVHEQVLEEDVFGLMADVDPNARVLQRRRGVRVAQVATADLVAARQKNARERGYARAADPHQVNLHLPAISCRRASTRCAASRRPAPAEAFAIARRRSALRPSRVATRPAGVSSASPMRTAAPVSTIALAFSSWWPPPNVPGTSTIGRPTAAISAIVLTPARLTTRSASAINNGISSVKESPR